jgi:pilus assembly protein TadC
MYVGNITTLNRRASVLERRRARRFTVGWDISVKGTDDAGLSFDEAGVLENLSSTGAFFYLTKPLRIGAKLEVSIKVPFRRENWMKYSAEVVRIESGTRRIGIAMKFNTVRPSFSVK